MKQPFGRHIHALFPLSVYPKQVKRHCFRDTQRWQFPDTLHGMNTAVHPEAGAGLPHGIRRGICDDMGLLKNDFGFRRFLTRGRANIRSELFLPAIAFDLEKLWMKREHGRLQTRVSEKITA